MELNRISLPPLTTSGEVITFYAYESEPTRSVALANMGVLLAGRQHATVPVLMVDWDTESPGLDRYFDAPRDLPGVLEYFTACRAWLDAHPARRPDPADTDAALRVLDAVPWTDYVQRVDETRPLYLMRAGRVDEHFGARAAAMDWEGLFVRCPALFRCFADQLARHFRHVLVDARSGRAPAVSICTTFLPRKLVALFTPEAGSLEGLVGAVERAVDYRRAHQDEQRPLLVYPLPCSVDSADSARRTAWRRGAPGRPGYQPVLEQLLRAAYGQEQLSLDSYFDEVQLQHSFSLTGPRLAAHLERGGDRFSLTRTFEALLDWGGEGFLPWQSRTELHLLRAIHASRAAGTGAAADAALARDLDSLSQLYLGEGRLRQALTCCEDSLTRHERVHGARHAATRRCRARLAALQLGAGRLAEARRLYEQLVDEAGAAAADPERIAAQLGLAAVLAQQQQFDAALALHEQCSSVCERQFGPAHALTFDCLAAQADTHARAGDLSRARMLLERVLEGRQHLLGQAHDDTLACQHQLARRLLELGDLNHARALQESLVELRARHAGAEAPATVRERELLADILSEQGDLIGLQRLQADGGAGTSRQRQLAASLVPHAGLADARMAGARGVEPVAPAVAGGLAAALELELARLRRLLAEGALAGARELADAVRPTLREPDLGEPLRRSASELVKQTYQRLGDKDALVAFQEEQLRALEGALDEAQSGAA